MSKDTSFDIIYNIKVVFLTRKIKYISVTIPIISQVFKNHFLKFPSSSNNNITGPFILIKNLSLNAQINSALLIYLKEQTNMSIF